MIFSDTTLFESFPVLFVEPGSAVEVVRGAERTEVEDAKVVTFEVEVICAAELEDGDVVVEIADTVVDVLDASDGNRKGEPSCVPGPLFDNCLEDGEQLGTACKVKALSFALAIELSCIGAPGVDLFS